MTYKHIQDFERNTKSKPAKILMFRDGKVALSHRPPVVDLLQVYLRGSTLSPQSEQFLPWPY